MSHKVFTPLGQGVIVKEEHGQIIVLLNSGGTQAFWPHEVFAPAAVKPRKIVHERRSAVLNGQC
jgi:hypothetical protein